MGHSQFHRKMQNFRWRSNGFETYRKSFSVILPFLVFVLSFREHLVSDWLQYVASVLYSNHNAYVKKTIVYKSVAKRCVAKCIVVQCSVVQCSIIQDTSQIIEMNNPSKEWDFLCVKSQISL